MFVLRAKVTLVRRSRRASRASVSAAPTPRAPFAPRSAKRPAVFGVARQGEADMLGVPGPRFIVVTPAADAERRTAAALAPHARAAAFDGLAVAHDSRRRAGDHRSRRRTSSSPQTANWDVLGGVNFQKGCYTGQEIIARTQYLGRLKERLFAFHAPCATVGPPGDRLYSPAFGEQPCGTVVNAAPAPDGGCELLAVLQLAAAASGDVRLGALDGPR